MLNDVCEFSAYFSLSLWERLGEGVVHARPSSQPSPIGRRKIKKNLHTMLKNRKHGRN